MYSSPYRRSIFPSDTPVTNFLIISNAVSFALLFLQIFPAFLYELLVGSSLSAWSMPWTLFTYPLITAPGGAFKFLNLLIGLYYLYIVGGMLERRWGMRRFLFTFFGFSAVSALFLVIGGMLLHGAVGFGELFLPLVDLTVLWALMEPEAPVIFFIFPMQLRWLAILISLMALFEFGSVNPLLGFFALGGPLAAILYTRMSRNSPGPRSKPPTSGGRSFSPFEWYRQWKFKRKFKRLWG